MDKSGRFVLVQSVLCAMPIHTMMALDVSPKVLASLTKICRGFLWACHADAGRGHCSVAWDVVCMPKWAGGLGLPNLRWLKISMCARWLWLKRVEDSRPWAQFHIQVPPESHAIYRAPIFVDIGDGRTSFFWEDRWLQDRRVQEIAPRIYDRIRPAVRCNRTVVEALVDCGHMMFART